MIMQYTQLSNFQHTFLQITQHASNTSKTVISIELFYQKSFYKNVFDEGDRNRKKLLGQISSNNYYFWFLKNVMDVHLFSLLLPKNVTLEFKYEIAANPLKWKVIRTDACQNDAIYTHGKL